jgi:hypothetical protein
VQARAAPPPARAPPPVELCAAPPADLDPHFAYKPPLRQDVGDAFALPVF